MIGASGEHKKIYRLFRQSGAVSVDLAVSLKEIGLRRTALINRMIREGVIVAGGADTFFLDETQLMRRKLERVKWAMILLLIVLTAVMVWLTAA